MASADKPLNVIFIAVDDMNDWVGVVGGHPQAKTPNMDRLVELTGAMVFNRAYCPATVCGPSRSSILTGLRPSTTGVYGNGNNLKASPVAKDATTLPQYFSEHGYHTLSSGKIFHKHPVWEGMDEGQWAFDEWASNGGKTGVDTSKGPLNKLPMLKGGGGRKGRGLEFDWGPTGVPVEETGDYKTCAWAAEQLDRDFDGKPFFMAVGVSKPHLPFYVPQEFFNMHPLEDVQIPEIVPDDLDDIKNPKGKNKFKPSDDFQRVQNANMFKEVTQAYLAAVSYADYCVGVVLDKLEKSPYADNTIVVIWGDHGWFLGEKLRYRKTHLWEESTRVPLIIRVPELTQPGSRSNRIVNLLDLYPTLAEWCGLPTKEGLEGVSFADLKSLAPEDERPTLTTMGYKNHSVRGDRYRYTRYDDGTEELYDHLKDPMERRNLITDPEMKPVVKQMRAYLPKHDEPRSPDNDIDKKRLRRTLGKIFKMDPKYRDMANRGELDPEFVKSIFNETK
ncbi:sulfatase [Puniceicoccales bacterium CK1056]|uniref:Sulfatase n=2 Tax=Oceanipulchritudo coccoides TaxID=2706888 RepID=A0A6B2LXL0_9BACT|nr:sulfatase [Oceanipulchritudo coccoides]